MTKSHDFASTAQPGTQNDNILARWPAKPPSLLLSFNMLTSVLYSWVKLNAPNPTTTAWFYVVNEQKTAFLFSHIIIL